MQGDIAHHRHVSVREVAVHISNHTMAVGDRGVVVVGASAELGDLGHLGSAGRQPPSFSNLPQKPEATASMLLGNLMSFMMGPRHAWQLLHGQNDPLLMRRCPHAAAGYPCA